MTRSDAPPIHVSRRGSNSGDPDAAVVWLRGEHDIATKVSVGVAILRAGRQVPVRVDLAGVTFMDASTVAAIVGASNRLRGRGQSLELRAPSVRARRVLDLCGVAHLVQGAPRGGGPVPALQSWVDISPAGVVAEVEAHPSPVRPGARPLAGVDRRRR